MIRVSLLLLPVALLTVHPGEASAQTWFPSRATYFKYMRSGDAAQLRRGDTLEPRFARRANPWVRSSASGKVQLVGRNPLAEYRDAYARTERLVERARWRVAPNKPSRLNSIFAASDPSLWRSDLADQGQRVLVKLRPLPWRNKVAVVDARYFEQAFALMERLPAARSHAELRSLVRRARRLAEQYWTRPAAGAGARQDARPEVLLGGGARFVGAAR